MRSLATVSDADDFVAERHEVVGDGERRRAGADADDALAVLLLGRARQAIPDVVAVIGGDALQAADCDRLGLDAPAAARRLARTVADAAENAGKNVRFTVDQVGLRELTLRYQPNVFGDVGMGRAGPLAVDYAMIVIRISSIGRFHRYLALDAKKGASLYPMGRVGKRSEP